MYIIYKQMPSENAHQPESVTIKRTKQEAISAEHMEKPGIEFNVQNEMYHCILYDGWHNIFHALFACGVLISWGCNFYRLHDFQHIQPHPHFYVWLERAFR